MYRDVDTELAKPIVKRAAKAGGDELRPKVRVRRAGGWLTRVRRVAEQAGQHPWRSRASHLLRASAVAPRRLSALHRTPPPLHAQEELPITGQAFEEGQLWLCATETDNQRYQFVYRLAEIDR
jgi:hypothetical protein